MEGNTPADATAWHGVPPNRFNPHAWIVGEPLIGDGVWIGAFTVIDGSGGLTIGDGCEISSGAQIYSHSTVARCVSERASGTERAATTIGAHVHVGANAVILMGASIGDHSVVAAGAVVREHTVAPPYSVLKGVPARVVEGAASKFMPHAP
ncbi:acyltransferase [Microbacterium sp. zg.B48]|uniref:acyltransferase n=1 Tax=unclassified Microbacterium TaxID=2609290 RepID=UPI00214AAB35|nr:MULTISPECIES: acyltransferase [unclassified Microbacterium]MCR2765139.1 acyltransferase [Microbacterium sp. zg.B48]MCR2810260.1 acyltransferase [Microbacterium sp. zg.B185]WIM19911.1 acyltransferase [Microbacterium sp. zg-B185]